jgi:ribonuclease-3
MDQCRRFVHEKILDGAEISDTHKIADYKTALQELVQRKSDQKIIYAMTGESGPDHNKTFNFSVSINGVVTGEGSGRTKKEAEQMAAKKALEALKQ